MEDKDSLTPEIVALQRHGLTIRYCENLRSYKKIVPTLAAHPDAYVVTADDDVYYWPTWLEELVVSQNGGGEGVSCHWAHCIRVGEDGRPLPYDSWERGTKNQKRGPLIFPVGVGGVLYPPGSLHRDVTNTGLFQILCPNADDVWLYWMMRRSGAMARKISSRRLFPTWPGSQDFALHHSNDAGGGNDRCVAAMSAEFGHMVSRTGRNWN